MLYAHECLYYVFQKDMCVRGFCICDANIFKALLDIHSKGKFISMKANEDMISD